MSKSDRPPVAHYQRGGIECIDAMEAISTPEEFRGYLRLTAFKYLWRLGEKDEPAKEIRKALDYVSWLLDKLDPEVGCSGVKRATKVVNGVTYEPLNHGDTILPGDRFPEVATWIADRTANAYGVIRRIAIAFFHKLRPVK